VYVHPYVRELEYLLDVLINSQLVFGHWQTLHDLRKRSFEASSQQEACSRDTETGMDVLPLRGVFMQSSASKAIVLKWWGEVYKRQLMPLKLVNEAIMLNVRSEYTDYFARSQGLKDLLTYSEYEYKQSPSLTARLGLVRGEAVIVRFIPSDIMLKVTASGP